MIEEEIPCNKITFKKETKFTKRPLKIAPNLDDPTKSSLNSGQITLEESIFSSEEEGDINIESPCSSIMIKPSDSISEISKSGSDAQKKKSLAWDYFTKISEKQLVKCNSCEQKYSIACSTVTLMRHYTKKHQNEKKELKITDFFHQGNSQETRTDLLSKLIIMENLPFKFVESLNFRNFAAALDSNFHLPCYKTLKKTISKTFLNEKDNIKSALKCNLSEISVTVDGWTSANNEPFYGLTGFKI